MSRSQRSRGKARRARDVASPEAAAVDRLAYHFLVWQGLFLLFLVLDFAKRLDDLLVELPPLALAANFWPPLCLSSLLALGMAALSVALARSRGPRPGNFLVVFAFLTVNLWSLKAGLAFWLLRLEPGTRQALSWSLLLLVLAISAWAARRLPPTWGSLERRRGELCKLWTGFLLLLGLCLLAPSAESQAKGEGGPENLILVSFDALAARSTSLYGYSRPTTPQLEALASESWVFDAFHANFTNTPPALISLEGSLPLFGQGPPRPSGVGLFSLLRSRFPQRAFFSYFPPQWFFRFRGLPSEVSLRGRDTRLYRLLRAALPERYLLWTAGLLSEEPAYLWPYGRAYDSRGIFETSNHHPAAQSFQDALEFLDRHPGGGNALWVHLWEPHYPYWPEADLRGKFGPLSTPPPELINCAYQEADAAAVAGLRDRYDETVLGADRQLGAFVEQLRKRGLDKTTWLVVTSDHGEAFGDGFVGHAGDSVNEAICQIPLLIRPPGGTKPLRVRTLACRC